MKFGEESAEKIIMLGVFIGREVDTEERLKRMRKSSFILRKRLKNSKLSKKHQAKIVELCVESTGLFNCSIRPWHAAEIRKLQRYVDKLYRYVWSETLKCYEKISAAYSSNYSTVEDIAYLHKLDLKSLTNNSAYYNKFSITMW